MAYNHKFGQVSLVCHAFNAKSTEMAISLNSNDVFIFQVPQLGRGRFVFKDRLQQHTSVVRSIDWAPKTDRIVSCSKDRNAYVWTRNSDSWKPVLVILQLNRAATFVRWSPEENKFAVGSGAKVVSVCCFEKDNDFWVSKHLKKGFNSTVTCLDWHPGNNVIACGSTDFKVRVLGAFLKSSGDENLSHESQWGKGCKFNTLLWEKGVPGGTGSWVHGVAFSKDGSKLAWTCHGSTIAVADARGGPDVDPVVSILQLELLPFQTLLWAGPSTIIAAGHDCMPYTFHLNGNNLVLGSSIDSQESGENEEELSAKNKFQRIAKGATTESNVSNLNSMHQNTINEIRLMRGSRESAEVISTVARDGQLVLWDLKTLQQRMADLKIC